jgi:histidinol-phosphate/aromatic aminotransferase/cobyric acid decarboxylase-like protein
LNSGRKEEKEEKRDVSACVWIRYVSITVLGLNIVDRSVIQVKKTIDADPSIKLIFLCSPGNPTGTLISLASIRALLDYEPFKGMVVVDEAYIDFSEPGSSAASLVAEYANICVMQTLSKSFGLAAIRCRLTSHFPLTCSSYSFNADSV